MFLRCITPLLIIKTLVFITFTYLFIILFAEDLQKYQNKITATGIKTRPEEAKPLPCITFCPFYGFKTKGFFYTNKTFNENSYDPEEFFNMTSLDQFQNLPQYVFKKINTLLWGRCYTMCNLRESKIVLKTYTDLKIFVHIDGDEFWLTLGLPYLLEMADTVLDLNRTDGINIGIHCLCFISFNLQ